MKESQKELIRDIANVSHWSYEVKLKQEFPEAFEAKLEVGKWHVLVSNPKHIFYVKEVTSLYFYYGFNVSGVWRDEDCYGVYALDNVREATKEEVEVALIKEAKVRGVWNAPIKCLETKVDLGHCPAIETNFNIKYNKLESPRGIVFKDGKWAEPLHKELTVAQIEEELGYKVKIVKE